MTVEATDRKQAAQNMNGVTTEFDFTFQALAATDIKCKIKDASGTVTTLTYETDYSVELNDDGVGGTVTVADPQESGYTITIYRETSNLQESDYENYESFPADTFEEDLDRRAMVSQENAEDMDRTLKLPITSSLSDIEVPEPESNALIGWNAAGDGLENKDTLNASYVTDCQTAQAAAEAAQTAAETAQTAAEAARDEAEAIAGWDVDTDGTLAANSDTKIPSQKAVKTYADTALALKQTISTSRCKVYLGTNQENLVHNTATKVLLDTVVTDPLSQFNVTTHRFTATEAGIYLVSGSVFFNNPVADKYYVVSLRKNGSEFRLATVQPSINNYLCPPLADWIDLAVGDYVELYAQSNSDSNTVDILAGTPHTSLSICKISS